MAPPDTIAAIASASGRGAVGVIRLSGPEVPRLAMAMLGDLPAPRTAKLARFLDANGQSLDQGLALYFPAPASFTGEEVLELQGHGGTQVLDLVLRRLLELGARMARPGEFTERAFLNGKIDLSQAEAIADLIDAGSAAAAKAAVRSLQGDFSARVQALKAQLIALRIQVEAAIDFPDEEIDFLADPEVIRRITQLHNDFDSLMLAAHQGSLLRDGLHVVIAGKPNAGKSSLLNKLAGDEIAIVTDTPGTTRDLLRQQINLDGLPIHIVDTAGLRTTVDQVEAEGIRRARSEMTQADRVLYIVDASASLANAQAASADDLSRLNPELALLPSGVPVSLVFNKIDLVGGRARVEESLTPPRVYLSARSGEGIDLLRAHLKLVAGFKEPEAGLFVSRRRHLEALRRARDLSVNAAGALSNCGAFELFAEDLRLAQCALSEITGEFSSDDLLGEIFGNFCIGK